MNSEITLKKGREKKVCSPTKGTNASFIPQQASPPKQKSTRNQKEIEQSSIYTKEYHLIAEGTQVEVNKDIFEQNKRLKNESYIERYENLRKSASPVKQGSIRNEYPFAVRDSGEVQQKVQTGLSQQNQQQTEVQVLENNERRILLQNCVCAQDKTITITYTPSDNQLNYSNQDNQFSSQEEEEHLSDDQRVKQKMRENNICYSCYSNYYTNNEMILNQKPFLKDFLQGVKPTKLTKKFEQYQHQIEIKLKEKNYFISSYLSSGGEGIIFDGFTLTAPEQQDDVVFKIIFTNRQKDFSDEVNILKLFEKRINVIEYKNSFEILKDQVYVIILEKCVRSLCAELKSITSFTEIMLLQIVFDLIDGLLQFRIYNILHLDIKPGNILISKKGVYLYTDFGISSVKKLETPILIKGFTEKYASFQQQQYDQNIDFNADVYSLGKTFQEIISTYKRLNSYESNSLVLILDDLVINHMVTEQKDQQKDCLQLHCHIYEKILSSQYKPFLEYYSQKVKDIISLEQFDKNKDIPYFLQLKLHYQIILLKAQYEIYDNKPHENIAETLQQIGLNYCELGDPQTGLKQELESLKIRRSIKDSSQTSQTTIAGLLNSIGCSYSRLGDFNNSLKYLEESLLLKRELFPGDSFEIAKTLNNLACNYQIIGKFDLSLKFMLESLEMRKKLFAYNHPSILIMVRSIGIYYYKMGQTLKADHYLNEQLRMAKQIYSQQDSHPQIAQAFHFLSFHQKALGCSKKALILELQSVEMTKKIHKKEHADLASSYTTLCSYYNDLQEYKIALTYGLESLDIERVVFNQCFESNPEVALALSNISKSSCGLGMYDLGLEAALKSLELRKQIYGGSHTDIADSIRDVGGIHYLSNNLNKAIILFLQSIDMYRLYYKRSHPKIADTLFDLGNSYKKQRENNIALQYFEESLSMRQDMLIKDHPDIGNTFFQIGWCYRELGSNFSASHFFKQCLEQRKTRLNKNDPEIEQVLENIGDICYEQGEYKKALMYKLSVLEIRRCQYQRGHHTEIARTLNEIGNMLLLLGQLQTALKYKSRSLQVYQHFCQHNSAFAVYTMNFSSQFFAQLEIIKIHYSLFVSTNLRKQSCFQIVKVIEDLGNRCYLSGNLQKASLQFQRALYIRLSHFREQGETLENTVGLIVTLNKILNCFLILFYSKKC